jgi:hypothetical protein
MEFISGSEARLSGFFDVQLYRNERLPYQNSRSGSLCWISLGQNFSL